MKIITGQVWITRLEFLSIVSESMRIEPLGKG
jgi:hypothetical protein